MQLGAFSVSLAVKDLQASKAFYEALGFTAMGGDEAQGWLMLKSGPTVIGLFQGMFEKNILTFNPGWSQEATPLDTFTDVREIQKVLLSRGIALTRSASEDTTGPDYLTLEDPDGNQIMLDQHV